MFLYGERGGLYRDQALCKMTRNLTIHKIVERHGHTKTFRYVEDPATEEFVI